MNTAPNTAPQSEGPQAISSRELPTFGDRVIYVSRDLVAVKLQRDAEAYTVTLSGHVEGPHGRRWYVLKRSEPIATAEKAVSTYNTCGHWAEKVSEAAVTRYALQSIDQLLASLAKEEA